MAKRSVRNTALGAAVCRLIEQSQPEGVRLFDDQVVRYLVGAPVRTLMRFKSGRNFTVRRTDGVLEGLYGLQVCRTRFIDDVVRSSSSQAIDQLVILGAGLDTRPYRLAALASVKVFEVDLPSVQEDKKRKLVSHFGRLPDNVTFVPLDFDAQSIESAMADTHFEPARPALVIWEGVTQYVSEAAIERTLVYVGGLGEGSILVFTYVLKSVIDRRSGIPGADKLVEAVARSNAPWLFGLEPSSVAAFLERRNLELTVDAGSNDYQTMYLKPSGRNLAVSECERVAKAIVIRP